MADGSGRQRQFPPSANRGGKYLNGAAAIVDFVVFSAPISSVPSRPGEAWVESAFKQYLRGTPLQLDRVERGMRNFYEVSWRILTPEGQVAGFVAVGGNRDTWCMQLTGQACAYVGDWCRFADQVDAAGARLTRVDCAHDDFDGTHPIEWALDRFKEGAFVRGGRPPKARFIDDFGSGDGRTLYVGIDSGNQTLRAYEKGKQLGVPTSPWVRYEGQFGADYREISTDVLRYPGWFLAGMWPCLDWISAAVLKMRTAAKQVQASLVSLAGHCREQYGRLIHFAQSIYGADTQGFLRWVESISRSGLPAKLKLPHVGVLVSAAEWRNELCVSW